MIQTKVKFADLQTPEQRKAQAAHWRRADAYRRAFNNALGFWRVCKNPICRRRRGCSHDMHACFERHWWSLPEEEKEYWRGCLTAAATARRPEELHEAGLAARDACLNSKTRID
jgi:hypothetical protein